MEYVKGIIAVVQIVQECLMVIAGTVIADV